ncbi:MAG TPA: DegT/DnrJ/EryC1/StrS family aminotransferase [Patescibacteria group bacterium]|nr:DegT/DnrJ/EryC1/StrS family aminotransferase [Patescibacteria group bacterium]
MIIPIHAPLLTPKAKKYIDECLKKNWLSGSTPMVQRFENAFAKYVGTKYAVAVNSGTAAVHIALAALGIGPGDEVLVPTLTMVATVAAILYQGAIPVFVDSQALTGNIDPEKIIPKITKKTKAILVVHLHGHPADMSAILRVAKTYKLFIIEDAAEAHGAMYKTKSDWKMCGSIGTVGAFSFYANKLLTCGEGGMVVTNNGKLANRVRLLRNQSRDPNVQFLHIELGFTYRMQSLSAAIGLSQVRDARILLRKKKHIVSLYNKLLQPLTSITLPVQLPYAKSTYWQYGILTHKSAKLTRDQLVKKLEKSGIETRTFFVPMHRQPFLKQYSTGSYPIADDFSARGLCLPSGAGLTDTQVRFICKSLMKLLT